MNFSQNNLSKKRFKSDLIIKKYIKYTSLDPSISLLAILFTITSEDYLNTYEIIDILL